MPFFTTGPIENSFANPVTDITLNFANNNSSTNNLRARVYDLSTGNKVLIADTGTVPHGPCESSSHPFSISTSRYEVLFSANKGNVLFAHNGFDSSGDALSEYVILNKELTEVNGASLNCYPGA